MPRRRYSRGYSKSRRRYGSKAGGLTGGTGDVNPQWFNLSNISGVVAINTAVSVESIVPLQQQALMASKGSKSMVMELLAIQYSKPATTGVGRIGITTRNITNATASAAINDLNINQPHVVHSMSFEAQEDGFCDHWQNCKVVSLNDKVLRTPPALMASHLLLKLILLIRLGMVSSSVARRFTFLVTSPLPLLPPIRSPPVFSSVGRMSVSRSISASLRANWLSREINRPYIVLFSFLPRVLGVCILIYRPIVRAIGFPKWVLGVCMKVYRPIVRVGGNMGG